MLPAAKDFNPSVQHGRESPVGALEYQSLKHQSQSSTQRDPSSFKAVMNSLQPVCRCGNYGEARHNNRRCRQPLPTLAVTAFVNFNALGGEAEWKHFGYQTKVN